MVQVVHVEYDQGFMHREREHIVGARIGKLANRLFQRSR